MKVRIYKPIKTATQSGKNNTKLWILETIEDTNSRSVDDITGWTSSDNTQTQVKLKFTDKNDAIRYAKQQDFSYIVEKEEITSVKQKSYSNNFTKKIL